MIRHVQRVAEHHDARVNWRAWPRPNVIETCSASFASSSWAIASSQYLSDSLSFETSLSLGHFALTLSAVVVSSADSVGCSGPNLVQKR